MILTKAYIYLFYRLYIYANKTEKSLGQAGMPEWIALFSISIVLFINIGILFFLITYLFDIQINISKVSIFFLVAIVYFFNYIFFIRHKKYVEIINLYKKESRRQSYIRTSLVWLYLVISFVLFYVILPFLN